MELGSWSQEIQCARHSRVHYHFSRLQITLNDRIILLHLQGALTSSIVHNSLYSFTGCFCAPTSKVCKGYTLFPLIMDNTYNIIKAAGEPLSIFTERILIHKTLNVLCNQCSNSH